MFRTLFFACLFTTAASAQQQVFVSPAGDNNAAGTILHPWQTAQYALDHATAGTTIFLMGGTYHENLEVPVSGNTGAPVIISGYASESAVIDGSGTTGNFLLKITSKNNIIVQHLVFRGLSVNNSSAVFIGGTSSSVEIRENRFSGINFSSDPNDPVITGKSAHAIFVAGNNPAGPVSGIKISDNEITDCRTGKSPAVEISGNVLDFEIVRNKIHHLSNSGIGITGFKNICPDVLLDQPKTGTISKNSVYNCSSVSENAAGILADGASSCIIENNSVYLNTNGMVFCCSAAGKTTSSMLCRDNSVYRNTVYGIALGNSSLPSGITEGCSIKCNTFFENNTGGNGAEILLGVLDYTTLSNNIIAGNSNSALVHNERGSASLVMNYNLYYSQSSPEFYWNGNSVSSFLQWQSASAVDSLSIFTNPLFINPVIADLHLEMNSPAIDHGDPQYAFALNETDMDTMTRVQNGRVDIGADEYGTAVGISESQDIYYGNSATPGNSSIYYYDAGQADFIVHVTPATERSFVYLYDATGQLLAVQELKKGESIANFGNKQLPSGIYIASVNNASLKISK